MPWPKRLTRPVRYSWRHWFHYLRSDSLPITSHLWLRELMALLWHLADVLLFQIYEIYFFQSDRFRPCNVYPLLTMICIIDCFLFHNSRNDLMKIYCLFVKETCADYFFTSSSYRYGYKLKIAFHLCWFNLDYLAMQ